MKFKLSNIILFFAFIGLIVIYFVLISFRTNHNRFTLYLLNARTGKLGSEARYVLKTDSKSLEQQFVEELILGPMNHNFYDFFDKHTKYTACFVDGQTLYVSFPKAVLLEIQERMPFEKFYNLFEKNIFANFSHINEVCMFLDGVEVYGKEVN